jgi:four helix bundle protein
MSVREPKTPDAAESSRVRLVDDARGVGAPHDRDTAAAHRVRPTPSAPRPTTDETRTTTDETRTTIHAHDHAHDHDDDHDHATYQPGSFPHEKLDAYRVALDLAGAARQLAAQIPRGHRSLADHLLRAATNTALLLAEGANRRGTGEKRQRFVESRGECGEAAAAADLARVMDLAAPADAEAVKLLAGRVAAMLTRLIARLR